MDYHHHSNNDGRTTTPKVGSYLLHDSFSAILGENRNNNPGCTTNTAAGNSGGLLSNGLLINNNRNINITNISDLNLPKFTHSHLNTTTTTTALTTSNTAGCLTTTTMTTTSRDLNSTLINEPTMTMTTPTQTPVNLPKSTTSGLLQKLLDDMRQIEDTVDSIEIPARGRCRVYMAKFGYDPFDQSPNENPEAELALNAGDYIMVFDDIDEDGYFIGELIDGRRGYVPSNYLERLTGDDLFDFQANVLYKQQANNNNINNNNQLHNNTNHQQHLTQSSLLNGTHLTSLMNDLDNQDNINNNNNASISNLFNSSTTHNNNNNSYPPEFYEAIIGETLNHSNFQHLLLDPEDYHRMNDYVDLDDVNEVDDECLSDYERAEAEQMRRAVPPPQRLVIERQLNKSILISWLHPQAAKGTIVSYQIYVDGVLKSTVPSGDRTKALLEGVDSNVPHRISVRAIDLHANFSNDAACTIVTGKQVPFAPACVKASHITSDSALISWLPCNSNFHHTVAVNSVELQTVRPGVYKHLINGLSANTLYRVWVRAKPGKILSIDEKNPKKLESLTTYVDFKTMPKSLPDPPVNVQVEAGPQRRTLLVTWLPLTLNDFGVSNGCPVTGYAVFAGHKKLADIDSPTGDHALLDLADLESLHKKSVTVRTKSGENLSQDSMPCHIPDEYLKSAGSTATTRHNNTHNTASHDHNFHQPRHASQYAPNAFVAARLSGSSDQQPHQRMAGSAGYAHQSPHRTNRRYPHSNNHHQQQRSGQRSHISRSLHNLDSDFDVMSQRSSNLAAANELTRDAAANGDLLASNQQTCESYSEEEFENSMRCRGLKAGGHAARGANRGQSRFKSSRNDSHSLDGGGRSGLVLPPQAASQLRPAESLAKLRALNQGARFFVALFDYDPSIMSPNPNAVDEELTFKEGSIIKVFGDKGLDGFYHGELDGRVGFVPCNVISEIRDNALLLSLQEKHRLKQQQATMFANQSLHHTNPMIPPTNQLNNFNQPTNQLNQQQQQLNPMMTDQHQQQQTPFKRMVALYDYDPQENSPNADTESEIPFKQGDVIYIYGKMDTDGFFMGEVERTKQRGLVPSNFLRDEQLSLAGHQIANNPNVNSTSAPNMIPNTNNLTNVNKQQQMMNQQQQVRPMNPMDANNFQRQPPVQPAPRSINPGQFISLTGQNNMNMTQQQQQQMALQQQQQNATLINRPNSLSLGSQNMNPNQNQMSNVPRPNAFMNNSQQQQQQPIPNSQMMMGQNPNMNQQQQQQQAQMAQQQAFQQQQQLQQAQLQNNNNNPNNQQQPGGVLSNLLSSGKQIIGAATTPRQQPNQIGISMANSMGTMGMVNQNNNNNSQFNQNMNMNNNPLNVANQVKMQSMNNQQPMQPPLQMQGNPQLDSMGRPFRQTMNAPMMNGPMLYGQPNSGLPNDGLLNNNNNINMTNQTNANTNMMQNVNQQQHPYNPNMNPNMNPQVRQGVGAGPMGQLMGEEQGGNILNTVKNMFKL